MNSYSPVAAQHARPDYDRTLLWLAILLLGFGLVMVYSSSIAIAAADKHTGFQESYYLMRQAVYLGVGALFGLFAFQVPNKVLQETAPYLFLSGLVLLVLVLIPG
ncbi:MAG: FtsW/RodA/SpoVE family cell cycle protein, partial [Sulfuricella sp.]|nr:FtsW/RodA/SpoVE family cell cycle protein [Sulfuricella sp.]